MRGRLPYSRDGESRRQSGLINGTLFEASKLALGRSALAMQLSIPSKNNACALKLERRLSVSYRSARQLEHKIMQAIHFAGDRWELAGHIEIDDASLSGGFADGEPGCGSNNKVPFVAAVQTTADGRPLYACPSHQPPRRRARAHPHRRRQGQFDTAAVHAGQHAAGQPEDGQHRRLPRLRLRQASPPLPRRVPVPLQPSFKLKTMLSHSIRALAVAPPSCEHRLQVARLAR